MVFTRTVVAANLAVVTTGICFGWTSPSISSLRDPDTPGLTITDREASWIASLMTLGSAIGVIASSILLNRVGRKITLLLSTVPFISGWLWIVFADRAMHMYIGRIILGLGTGLTLTVIPLYFSEIAPTKNRGATGSSIFFALKLGILIAYIFGMLVSVRILSLVALVFPCMFGTLFFWCPESPYYLVYRGEHDKARVTLMHLRGSLKIDEEMDMIVKMIESDVSTNTSILDLFLVRSNRKACFIMFFLVLVQYTTGSQAITAYAEIIFDAARSRVSGGYLAIILGAVQLVSVVFTIACVDRGGRRVLLLLSTSGVTICTFLIAVYFYVQNDGQEVEELKWIACISVILFTIMYALGLSSIPNMMVGEMFPASVKPKAAGLLGILADICSFFIIKFFYALSKAEGMHVPFFLFTLFGLLGICHIAFFLPETKRKTLQEVQDILVLGRNTYIPRIDHKLFS
ncbi:facilitated trehalose transporter Tret1-like [Prorops nasuta]|uniref:facilitated trehalose transporter Tret1-like n=1 Tax=Prorops nasuta TaxID=863751 RepID=UPI0034CDB1F2